MNDILTYVAAFRRRWLEPTEKALNNAVQWAAKIDWGDALRMAETITDARWQQHLVMHVAKSALARDDLNEDDRNRISSDLEKFQIDFAEIIQSQETCNKETVLRVVQHALFIGYAAGVRPEKVDDFRADVEKEASSRFGSRGGEASGVQRKPEANETWKPHALDIAKKSRKEDLNKSQADVAEDIVDQWLLKIPCPKTQLVLTIREWEKKGLLAKRK
jgi:hypothetical protein